MGKSRSPAHEAEFNALRDHLIHLGDFLDREGLSTAGLGAYWRKIFHDPPPGARPVSLSGLRMAANDMLEMTRYLSRQALADADSHLREQGSLTLSERRRTVWRQIPKILGRGKVRNDEEYYLLKELTIATTDTELTPTDRETATEMLAEYERRQASRAPDAG